MSVAWIKSVNSHEMVTSKSYDAFNNYQLGFSYKEELALIN